MNLPKVLIVDDDINILEVLSANLSAHEFNIVTAQSGEQALEILERDSEINVVITDLAMDEMRGEDLFQEINRLYPYIPVIILTAYGSIESAVRLVKEGAFDYLEKPSDNIQLLRLLEAAVRHSSLQREIQFLRQELDKQKVFCNIVGKSRGMLEVFELVKVVADTDHNVLIEGESGTGKELVALAIHQRSSRRGNPFVPINCAAIPHTLMESELFGYESGAFTGAVNQKLGKFELANKGTLFLDEIAELDKDLQTKLLRVLEGKTIHRIGGNADIQLDFRLIAATNRNLKEEIQENNFRKDLYYRLNVINIKIPPLRQRGEDIVCLAEFFLKKYSALEKKKQVSGISPRALSVLCNYSWPGNVRELENIIKRAVILCKGGMIRKTNLPADLIAATSQSMGEEQRKTAKIKKIREKDRIIEALQKAGGNKTKAARVAQISRRQLYRKIEEFAIDCEAFEV